MSVLDHGDGLTSAGDSQGVPPGDGEPDGGQAHGPAATPGRPAEATVRFRLAGRVQGVGFRYFVRRRALALGIRGWVRNAPDGSVEAEATGAPQSLADLEAELWKGPPGARVDRVERAELPNPLAVTGFEIVG